MASTSASTRRAHVFRAPERGTAALSPFAAVPAAAGERHVLVVGAPGTPKRALAELLPAATSVRLAESLPLEEGEGEGGRGAAARPRFDVVVFLVDFDNAASLATLAKAARAVAASLFVRRGRCLIVGVNEGRSPAFKRSDLERVARLFNRTPVLCAPLDEAARQVSEALRPADALLMNVLERRRGPLK